MNFLSRLFSKSRSAEKYFELAFEEETVYHNYKKASNLYEKSAELGLAKAQFYCGYIFLKGRGVPRNYSRAFELVEKSAQQNHPQAQFLLSQMYFSGEGVKKSEIKGEYWLNKFNEHNIPAQRLSFHCF